MRKPITHRANRDFVNVPATDEYRSLSTWHRMKLRRELLAEGTRELPQAAVGQPAWNRGVRGVIKWTEEAKARIRGRPRPWLDGPRPDRWKIKDPLLHELHQPWHKARAQAHYRGEEWLLTFEEFAEVWRGKWEQRGRQRDDLCMTRTDVEGAWARDNVEIVTRLEWARRGRDRRMSSK
jgi:hypothetical protein